MNIISIGINYKTAEIKRREKFSLTKEKIKQSFIKLNEIDSISGSVILSTCNRMEIYVHVNSNLKTGEFLLKEFIFKNFYCDENELNEYFYTFENLNAVRHLFKVICGLDSQVLGETEIFGQIKDAFLFAKEVAAVDPFIEEIFNRAIYIGKSARIKTDISKGNVSVASIAIKKCEDLLGVLEKKESLIIGAGNIAFLLSKYLKEKNMKGIFVSNRTFQKAQELADFCEGNAIKFDSLNDKLKTADIVISSTASPHFVLKKEQVMKIMSKRKKTLVILDLAMPRDVDPSIKEISGIYLYDLDSLKFVAEENYEKRKKEVKKVEIIIENELKNFLEETKWEKQSKFVKQV